MLFSRSNYKFPKMLIKKNTIKQAAYNRTREQVVYRSYMYHFGPIFFIRPCCDMLPAGELKNVQKTSLKLQASCDAWFPPLRWTAAIRRPFSAASSRNLCLSLGQKKEVVEDARYHQECVHML